MRMHSRDEFQTWLAGDLEVRDELYDLMGGDPGVELDSLDGLEAFVLRRWPTIEAALTLEQRGVLDAAARHVGLVMILNIDGAVWDLALDDADAFYRLPIVRFENGDHDCPLSLVTAALDRRTGDYVHDVVGGYAEAFNEPDAGSPPGAPASR